MPISLRSMENVAAPQDDRGVYLLDAAEVRTATDGALELSAIWMYPEPGPDAWVARMVVKARAMAGSSPAVELPGPGDRGGLPRRRIPGGGPPPGPEDDPPGPVTLGGPRPGGRKIEGWARVDYYDADVEGHAIIPGPGEPPAPFVEARWRLFTRKPDVTIDVDPDPLVVAAGTSETLKIIVVGGPAEAIPAVALGDRSSLPDWVAVDRLEATLAARPRLVEEPDGRRVFDLWVTVPAVERPGARGGSDEASFSLRTTLPGTDAARDHRLVIRSGGIAFPGWVAIDFGTSSSTATIYDRGLTVPQPLVSDLEARPAGGLPAEQDARLRELLGRWLGLAPGDTLPGLPGAEARSREFLDDVNLGLDGGRPTAEVLRDVDRVALDDALRRIESHLTFCDSEPVKRAIAGRLHAIYHEAFRVPPLGQLQLDRVRLDPDDKEYEIASDLQVVQVQPLQVEMGAVVRNRHRAAIQGAKVETLRAIRGQFHPSPKRSVGEGGKVWIQAATGPGASVLVDEPHPGGLGDAPRSDRGVPPPGRRAEEVVGRGDAARDRYLPDDRAATGPKAAAPPGRVAGLHHRPDRLRRGRLGGAVLPDARVPGVARGGPRGVPGPLPPCADRGTSEVVAERHGLRHRRRNDRPGPDPAHPRGDRPVRPGRGPRRRRAALQNHAEGARVVGPPPARRRVRHATRLPPAQGRHRRPRPEGHRRREGHQREARRPGRRVREAVQDRGEPLQPRLDPRGRQPPRLLLGCRRTR